MKTYTTNLHTANQTIIRSLSFAFLFLTTFTLLSCNGTNETNVSIRFERFASQTNLVATISNARPNVRLKVVAANVPRIAFKEVYVTTDSGGNATASIEYPFDVNNPNDVVPPTYCDLSSSEKQIRGILNTHDETNPNPEEVISKPVQFPIRLLFYTPVGGCS